MKEVVYSIGLDWRGKTKSLYLYRQVDNNITTIARFSTPIQAELFAIECDFPLSEKVTTFLENYKKEQSK